MCALKTHRLPEGLQDLSAQHVEVVSWVGAVHHDPVTVHQLLNGKVFGEFLRGRRGRHTDTVRQRGYREQRERDWGETGERLGRGSARERETHRHDVGVVIAHL